MIQSKLGHELNRIIAAAKSGDFMEEVDARTAIIRLYRGEVEYAVPRIRKWFRGSPCAIVIEFAGDITNAQVEALPRALMDALASDRQVLHSYNAHCAYCEWSREDVDGLAEGKKLAAEHAKTCKWHPMNAPRVGQRPDLYALAKADAQDWGDALNEAGWRYAEAFREIIGEPTSAAHWNNGKRVLREALLAFFTRVEKSAAPEGDKHE